MAATISYGLHDCSHIKLVSVISSFDCEGNIIPLYVRIGKESLRIYNAYQCGSTFRILNFNCQVMDHDRVKPLKLSYHKADLVWSMPVK